VLGKWQGNGVAEFPTTPTFDYTEDLEFVADDVHPFLRYEERTCRKTETGETSPSHWEAGFWRALPSGEMELVSAQGGGRVEVLRGRVQPSGDGFQVVLQSVLVQNDARMVQTARQFVLKVDKLEYSMLMSTTAVPDLTRHVRVTLKKA
jgi:hypothetical protein